MKMYLPFVLWGERFTERFLKWSLPSQMTPENLPYLAMRAEMVLCMFTPQEEKKRIESDPSFQTLRQMANVEWKILSQRDLIEKYRLVNRCHCEVLQQAGTSSPVLFPYPDQVFAEGSYQYLYQKIEEGRRLVLASTPKILQEPFACAVRKWPLSKRDLVQLAIEHLHPYSQAFFWHQDKINRWPSHLYWQLGHSALLLHGFHKHPFLVYAETAGRFSHTLDGGSLEKLCPDPSTWEMVMDSDEFAVFELNSLSDAPPLLWQERSMANVRKWAVCNTHPCHRVFFAKGQVLHSSDRNPAWDASIKAAQHAVEEILASLQEKTLLDLLEIAKQGCLNKAKGVWRRCAKLFIPCFQLLGTWV